MKLSVNTIDKSYKIFKEIVHANKDISFSMKSKNMVWLSGPTGSGKTTLINKDKQRTLFRKCNMGFILQHFELISSLTGFENILVPLKFSGKN